MHGRPQIAIGSLAELRARRVWQKPAGELGWPGTARRLLNCLAFPSGRAWALGSRWAGCQLLCVCVFMA